MIKKISQLLTAPLFYLFVAPSLVFADTNVNPCASTPSPWDKLCGLTFSNTVGRIVTLAFVLAVLIALVFLIYGGVKWITSGGDKTAVEGARNTIVAAVVGLVIVFLAYFILSLILQAFGLSFGSLVLPTITQ